VAGIAIRNATVADSERIARLVSELGYRTSPSQMRQRLEAILRDEDYDTLVACDEGKIVGFIGTRIGRLYEGDHSMAKSWHWPWRRTINGVELVGC
jgi:hypothetical protein